jgi:hypothetical protein
MSPNGDDTLNGTAGADQLVGGGPEQPAQWRGSAAAPERKRNYRNGSSQKRNGFQAGTRDAA